MPRVGKRETWLEEQNPSGLRLEYVDMAGTHISKTARCGPIANLFFAIIKLEMSVQGKKRDWFDLGAKAYSQACPGIYAVPTYVCPICRKPFTVEALDDGRLSKDTCHRKASAVMSSSSPARRATTWRELSWTPMQRPKRTYAWQ